MTRCRYGSLAFRAAWPRRAAITDGCDEGRPPPSRVRQPDFRSVASTNSRLLPGPGAATRGNRSTSCSVSPASVVARASRRWRRQSGRADSRADTVDERRLQARDSRLANRRCGLDARDRPGLMSAGALLEPRHALARRPLVRMSRMPRQLSQGVGQRAPGMSGMTETPSASATYAVSTWGSTLIEPG